METISDLDYEKQRMKVWSDAFCATANANDCKSVDIATAWADEALEAFDRRFQRNYR